MIALIAFIAFIVYSKNTKNTNKHNKHNTRDECVVLERRTLPDGAILEVVNDSCKEGLPHTTSGTTIRMTHAVANSPRYDTILVHERVHLDQKRRPTFWRDLVHRIWSYEVLVDPPAGLPSEWIDRRRPNPDTDQAPWALWRGRYLFFAAYNEDRRLKTASVHIWDLEARRLVPIPPEWQKQFSIDGQAPHQYEHPYELAAEFIAERSQCSAAAALAAADL
jgi:hypothetical protein